MVSEELDDIPPRPYLTYDTLSYQDFLKQHLLPNTPFLLSNKNTSDWAATSWRSPQSDGSGLCSAPNLSKLRQCAHHVVPVANTLQREYSEFQREEKALEEVLDLWEASHSADNGNSERKEGGGGEGLYVKDWHLFENIEKEGRGVGEVYNVPEYFQDDWMNPPYTPHPRSDGAWPHGDFRFCYLGPAGTFTPLHKDVYGSYSWSANIVGRKLWWIFRPDQRDEILDKAGDLIFDVRELKRGGEGTQAVKIVQEEGEIIWIPSGWYHQVLNLDFCISINHNFCSSPTLPRLFSALQEAQKRVEESISDILPMIQERLGTVDGTWEKEWIEEVQGLLERDAGWGWKGFWETVRRNIVHPPAKGSLAPDVATRDTFVLDVIERYRQLREWVILDDVRVIVEDVERLVGRGS